MASTRLASTVKLAIEESGFYIVQDADKRGSDAEATDSDETRNATKGRRFAQFWDDGYYTKSPSGLDFIFDNTMGDPEISTIIRSMIETPCWGYLRLYSSDQLPSDDALFFRQRDKQKSHEAIPGVFVQFWIPGSRAVFYKGSHLQYFDVHHPDNIGLWGVRRSNLEKAGFVPTLVEMPLGGYTIIDSRLGWTCEKGDFMNVGFGKEEAVAGWRPMELPDFALVRAKVAELEAKGLKTHFIFKGAS